MAYFQTLFSHQFLLLTDSGHSTLRDPLELDSELEAHGIILDDYHSVKRPREEATPPVQERLVTQVSIVWVSVCRSVCAGCLSVCLGICLPVVAVINNCSSYIIEEKRDLFGPKQQPHKPQNPRENRNFLPKTQKLRWGLWVVSGTFGKC